MAEGAFFVGHVTLRMQVADDGHIGERLIAVRDPRRQVELVMFVPIKVEAKLPKVRRRVRPDVDDDVFDRPVLAAYDLRLTVTDPHVHAAHDAEQRLRRVVLRPMRGQARRGERCLVKRAMEPTTMVTMDNRNDEPNAVHRSGQNLHDNAQSTDDRLWQRLIDVYPVARSLTGHEVRATLARVGRELAIDVHELPTGTEVLDWTIPDEWNLRRATLTAPDGRVVADTSVHPLHVVGYSESIDLDIDRDALEAHLFSLPDRPDAIPYRTSYYSRTWGFCITERARQTLGPGTYHATIDATLAPGSLTYGEVVLPGASNREILLTTHVCHPHMANDNASGIAALTEIGLRLAAREHRRHTVRLLYLPGSLGAIAWLATHRDVVPRITNGLVLTGLGNRGPLHYKRSRRGDTQTDRAAMVMLRDRGDDLCTQMLEFSPYGYDERQFCSPGFDLAVGRLTRGVHGEYPEYHTSLDDLAFVDRASMHDAVTAIEAWVDIVERDETYENLAPFGEPQLGRRGLYRQLGGVLDARSMEMAVLWVLNQADGTNSLIDIAMRSRLPFHAIADAADALVAADLLAPIKSEEPRMAPRR